jgi:Beta-galactosidase
VTRLLALAVALSIAMMMTIGCAVAPAAEAAPRVKLAPNGALLVDEKPFLPIMVWAQPSSLLEFHKALGVNVMHPGEKAEKDPPKAYLDKLQANGMLGLFNVEGFSDDLVGHPALLAWTVEHEPDVAQKPAYQPDLSGDATIIWIEAEATTENTFKPSVWLDKPLAQLSGRKWLTTDSEGKGHALIEFQADKAGTYTLWVREFTKSWANPTRWTLDKGPAKETSRSLSAAENINLGAGRGVAWANYGKVKLAAGKHTLKLEVVPGRTLGKADKEPAKKAIWAVDALCLTTGEGYPKPLKAEPLPKRLPSKEKENYERVKAADPNALTWNILTSGFYGPYNKLDLKWYREFLKYADITSFDHYPVTGWDKPGRLPEVGLATAKLVELARPGQPVWTIVEASDQELSWTAPQTKGPTPEEMRAEIWMSIAGGAKGIGYFTIAFGAKKKDGFKWNHLTDGIKAEMKRSNAQLTALAGPIVMGDTDKKLTVTDDATDDKSAQGHAIQAIRKEYKGATYIIAVNVTRQAISPTFTLDAPPAAAKATVWQENRTLDVTGGKIIDTFKPLEVHIYVLK